MPLGLKRQSEIHPCCPAKITFLLLRLLKEASARLECADAKLPLSWRFVTQKMVGPCITVNFGTIVIALVKVIQLRFKEAASWRRAIR